MPTRLNHSGPSLLPAALALSIALAACSPGSQESKGSQNGSPGGKADGAYVSQCQLDRVLALLNDSATTADTLGEANVPAGAAEDLVANRPYDSFAAIDEIDGVGESTIASLTTYVAGDCEATGEYEVIFSPAAYASSSHLARITSLIGQAQRSIDVAMYEFDADGIRDALGEAVERGVRVRMVFEKARADELETGAESALFEDVGVDVRYVNKIMHHKFAIFDGRETDADDSSDTILATGSGNWSQASATRFNENMLVVHGNAELVARFQGEFARLWNNSRDYAWNDSFAYEAIDETVGNVGTDEPDLDVKYTSDNFSIKTTTNGPTFSVMRGANTVADALVALIESAQRSIHIASGHLRSRPVAEALIAKKAENPAIDIRVVADGQEYIGLTSHESQVARLEACVEGATTDAQREACSDNDFLFGYQLGQDGIDVRYKLYAYRWNYVYADQMHDKFFIVDGENLATGSYNLSDNAEHNTLENMIFLDGPGHAAVVASYEEEFERIWTIGERDGLYDAYMEEIASGTGPIDIVFPSMTLEWSQIERLKRELSAACPDVNSQEFRMEPVKHQKCYR